MIKRMCSECGALYQIAEEDAEHDEFVCPDCVESDINPEQELDFSEKYMGFKDLEPDPALDEYPEYMYDTE